MALDEIRILYRTSLQIIRDFQYWSGNDDWVTFLDTSIIEFERTERGSRCL